jgi:type 1 glutamine amidotransferase
VCLLAAAASLCGQFRFRDLNGKSVEVTENGAPVFVYNYGRMLAPGAPEDRARCCYLHPVYAPNGVVITDDFPKDHYHHRGISWMWPVVTVDGQTYDLWTIKGIHARFEKWLRRDADHKQAVLAVRNGWYAGDRRVVEETVEITAHPAVSGRRDLDFSLSFRASDAAVSIAGTPDQGKGYGGFNIRFAPRTGTRIRTPDQSDAPDSDLKPQPWAELAGDFGGKPAAARITIDPSNPGAPNGWCLRHYGFLGVEFPGLQSYRLASDRPLVLKFRVSLIGKPAEERQPGRPAKKILVYTKNGKGYVHDNIAASVAAIRKMGDENGFGVDVSDDPNFFTGATLSQYQCIVFANTNNETFDRDVQREAFQDYIQHGGGFVGIHSASGSERQWPYFWAVLGGKFVRHPKMQKFVVRVADANHPATRDLPPSFEWTDECYYVDHVNPDIHPLLVTDPAHIEDPEKAAYPGDRFGDALPLAWYHEYDGGREFYTALGHNKTDYSNPILYRQILGGILWAMGEK